MKLDVSNTLTRICADTARQEQSECDDCIGTLPKKIKILFVGNVLYNFYVNNCYHIQLLVSIFI